MDYCFLKFNLFLVIDNIEEMAKSFRHNEPRTPARLLTNPEYEIPWRPVVWSKPTRDSMLRELKTFELKTSEVRSLKILLHGPIGAGKSSFINSVSTTLQGRINVVALADNIADTSFTTKLKIHRLKTEEPGRFYPFVFTDIMGLEERYNKGVHTDDVLSVLRGEVKNGYFFNPHCPVAEGNPHFKDDPSFKDKVHCLVSVLPANIISLTSEEVMKKMRCVHKMANDLGIPEVIIMSKVDLACPLVANNPRKIYTSKKIKDKLEECSNRSGVPLHCIFPVKNYSEETETDLDKDILILKAMTHIIRSASYYVEHQDYLH
ncbi:interferon-induced protein 44-like [Hoplias malabaricus]|uniref:interferon-induced protein 44-like n=1 Tax=Hoplias malabaricus TaxID=27720 RepID=UPI0034637E64